MTTILNGELHYSESEQLYVGEASDFGLTTFPERVTFDNLPYAIGASERNDNDLLWVRYEPVNHRMPSILLFND